MLDAAFNHMRHLIPISGTHVESSGDEILLGGHFEELSDLGCGRGRGVCNEKHQTLNILFMARS